MFNSCFSRIYDSLQRRKTLIILAVGLVTLVAGINLKSISFENNVESMLPADIEIKRTLQFLRDSHFSDKAVISLSLDSSKYSTRDLIRAVDQLSASLGPPLVANVISGISEANIMEEMLLLSKYTPQLFDEQALSQIDKQITSEAIKVRLGQIYRQLLSPASAFMRPLIQHDPLGISVRTFRDLGTLSSSLGYDVTIEQGHFISRDGKHALLFIETPINITDGFGSRKFIAYLRKQLEVLPDFVSSDIIAGHLHTISNEDVIKRDIHIMLIIAACAFFVLFLCVFRNIKALTIFLMPLASVIISMNFSSLIFKQLSYFVIGMGAVVVGIAIDYGIHVYVAMDTSGGQSDIIKHIAKPVLVGALTTLGVFVAFLFSSIAGYRQLGVFSIISILICLLFALFVLPHVLMIQRKKNLVSKAGKIVINKSQASNIFIVSFWIILMVGAGIISKGLVFDNDIRQFDGSKPEVFQSEERFHRIWGGNEEPAIAVVSGKTLNETSRRNELVYKQATEKIGVDNFSSITQVWPSKQTREVNTKRWKEFWRNGREKELKRLLNEQGPSYNFSEDAFDPFFESLYATSVADDIPEEINIFQRIKERFVLKNRKGYQIISFFPDKDEYIDTLSVIGKNSPWMFLVSRNALSRKISQSISSEAVFLSMVAGIFILALTLLLLRDVRMALIGLIPVISSLVAIFAVFSLCKLFLNVPAIIAAMVVAGLCIDYGIFMVYRFRYGVNAGTPKAVTLSAITTLIGAGVLLFSQHPVLFYIGVTLVIGVLSGYIASLGVVPSAYALWIRPKNNILQ